MFSDPTKNLEQFGLRVGQTVADLGSGSGHYTIASAKIVGEDGKVYAVDIQKDILARVKNDANKIGLFNVEVVWGDIEKEKGVGLKDHAVDAVIISNLMFQISDKEAVAREASRILKPGGKLLMVDWSDAFGGLGPIEGAIFPREQAVALFGNSGFSVDKDIDAGAHHYGIIFSHV